MWGSLRRRYERWLERRHRREGLRYPGLHRVQLYVGYDDDGVRTWHAGCSECGYFPGTYYSEDEAFRAAALHEGRYVAIPKRDRRKR